jgi:hypothetical protein
VQFFELKSVNRYYFAHQTIEELESKWLHQLARKKVIPPGLLLFQHLLILELVPHSLAKVHPKSNNQ